MEAQHLHANAKPQAKVEWSTGYFDCFSDCNSCCMTCWCPCITFGRVAEIVDQGTTSCCMAGVLYALINYTTGCGCLYLSYYRGKLRTQYNIRDDNCGDDLKDFFFGGELCGLTQLYRELKNRGFNMDHGWAGNVQKQQNQGVAMAAPVKQGSMTR